jgi:hypothetical protein
MPPQDTTLGDLGVSPPFCTARSGCAERRAKTKVTWSCVLRGCVLAPANIAGPEGRVANLQQRAGLREETVFASDLRFGSS